MGNFITQETYDKNYDNIKINQEYIITLPKKDENTNNTWLIKSMLMDGKQIHHSDVDFAQIFFHGITIDQTISDDTFKIASKTKCKLEIHFIYCDPNLNIPNEIDNKIYKLKFIN